LSAGLFDAERDGDRADVAEVEIGREPARAIHFRMVALLVVVLQAVGDEFAEVPEGGVRPAGEGVDGSDGAVEGLEACGDVLTERVASEGLLITPANLRFRIGRSYEESGQRLLEVGAHVLEEEVVAAEDGGGDNDVGVHRPVGRLEFTGQGFPPAFGLTAGVLIANEEGGLNFFEELFERVVRVAAKDEAYASFRSVGLYVAQRLLHEVVVAQIRVRVVGDDREEHDNRQAEEVGGVDCHIECGIVVDAHGALHPVDDALAMGPMRAIAADKDSSVVSELSERTR